MFINGTFSRNEQETWPNDSWAQAQYNHPKTSYPRILKLHGTGEFIVSVHQKNGNVDHVT